MTKDLATPDRPRQPWLTTTRFLDKLEEGIKAKVG